VNSKTAWLWLAIVSIAGVVASTCWYESRGRLHELRQSELAPTAALLKEDQELLKALQINSAQERESGILGSYLAAIRADGVAKHTDTKQKLDRLAENNAGILALINVYKPQARTPAFNAEAEKFQRYAIAWRDRWNSVMELFMAGGNYPVAEVPFPKEFLGAVHEEMEAADRVF
jgi:hypothetical protein